MSSGSVAKKGRKRPKRSLIQTERLEDGGLRKRVAFVALLTGAIVVVLFLSTLIVPERSEAAAKADPLTEYPLYNVSRNVPAKGRLRCPDVPLVRYRGSEVRYHKSGRFNPAFIKRLKRFEKVLVKTAIEFYGRAPKTLKHLGAYNCRRIRTYPTWISEHGLGNAIDVAGFDFGRATKNGDLVRAEEQVPRRLRRAFSVRVLKHWNGRGKVGKIHSAFLRTLARRLIARNDIFFVLLGPAFPGHKNHFHFDNSIFRMEHIFTPFP